MLVKLTPDVRLWVQYVPFITNIWVYICVQLKSCVFYTSLKQERYNFLSIITEYVIGVKVSEMEG